MRTKHSHVEKLFNASFLAGIASVFRVDGYGVKAVTYRAADSARDWEAVGNDMYTAMNSYGRTGKSVAANG